MRSFRRISQLAVWVVAVVAAGTATAGDLEDAYAAYNASDFIEAATLVRPLAREGIADAEFLYGRMFERGEGVVKDTLQAKGLYESAARHGHIKAKQRLVELAKSSPTKDTPATAGRRPTAGSSARTDVASFPASLSAEPIEPASPAVSAPRAASPAVDSAVPRSVMRNDESVAMSWYLDSAKRGDPEAQFNLGVLYETGMGVAVNEQEAARWYREAAAAKHDGAELRLGLLLMSHGDSASAGEGGKLLRGAAELGNKVAERFVQDILDTQRPGVDAQATMARRLRDALAQNEARALALLRDRRALTADTTTRSDNPVVARDEGTSGGRYFPTARDFMGQESASARSDDRPTFNPPEERPASPRGSESQIVRDRASKAPFLSDMGSEVPRLVDGPNGAQVVFPPSMAADIRTPSPVPAVSASSDADTLNNLRNAAQQGQGDAQFQLGMWLLSGKGGRRDENEGWQWIRKAGSQQVAAAQSYIRLIESTSAADASQSRAIGWLVEGARQGEAEAIYQLGNVYETGRGVPQNSALAKEWYRVAAALGHPGALRAGGSAIASSGGDAASANDMFVPQPKASQASGGDWIWILLTAAAAIAVLVMLFRSPAATLEVGRLSLPQMGGLGRRLFGGGLSPTQVQVTDMQLVQDLWMPEPPPRPAAPRMPHPSMDNSMPPPAPVMPAPAAAPIPPPVMAQPGGTVDLTTMPVTPPPAPRPAVATPPPGLAASGIPGGLTSVAVKDGIVDITDLPSAPPPGAEICPETGMLIIKAPIIPGDQGTTPSPAGASTRTPLADRFLNSEILRNDASDIRAQSVSRGQRTRERVSFDQFSDVPIGMMRDILYRGESAPAAADTDKAPASVPPPTTPPTGDNLITLPGETAQGGAAVPFNVGMMFYRGQGAPKNDRLAFRWFLKAAELNHTEAQFRIGEMYMNGYGVEKNRLLALKWIRKAAAAGYQPAVQALEDRKPKLLT